MVIAAFTPLSARHGAALVIYSSSPSETKGNILMETGHLSALTAKHAGLESRIAAESSRPLPDGTLIAMLKKQKLKIKETLQRL
jgi:hypothetical protein